MNARRKPQQQCVKTIASAPVVASRHTTSVVISNAFQRRCKFSTASDVEILRKQRCLIMSLPYLKGCPDVQRLNLSYPYLIFFTFYFGK